MGSHNLNWPDIRTPSLIALFATPNTADQSNPYNMVSIRGKVIDQITEGADEHTDTLAKKYLGMDKYPYRSPNEKRVILKIKPEKVFYQQPPK